MLFGFGCFTGPVTISFRPVATALIRSLRISVDRISRQKIKTGNGQSERRNGHERKRGSI